MTRVLLLDSDGNIDCDFRDGREGLSQNWLMAQPVSKTVVINRYEFNCKVGHVLFFNYVESFVTHSLSPYRTTFWKSKPNEAQVAAAVAQSV